jgi:glycosyltransferase involved in cell wall biosynthesis
MKIEAVIVCKDYSDFLEYTLPENIQHLDNVVVVTHPDDKRTQEICNKNSVHFVVTNCFNEKGHVFNKGQAINVGLDNIRGDDWILHLDADIVLCKDFRRMLDHSQLNPKNIYGADRINIYGYENWLKVQPLLRTHYQDRWFIDPGFCHKPGVVDGIKFGARVIHKEYGYIPIGFFQLFHSQHGRRYNHMRGSAAGTDIMFPAQWAKENRVLLPEIVVYHLDSEKEHMIGTNWKGRKSKPFGPEHHKHHHHHHHDGESHGYGWEVCEKKK